MGTTAQSEAITGITTNKPIMREPIVMQLDAAKEVLRDYFEGLGMEVTNIDLVNNQTDGALEFHIDGPKEIIKLNNQ